MKRNLSQGSLQNERKTKKYHKSVSESNPRATTKSILKKRKLDEEEARPKKTIKISSQIRTFTEKDAKEYRPRIENDNPSKENSFEINQVKKHLKNHFRIFQKKQIMKKINQKSNNHPQKNLKIKKQKFVPQITTTETIYYVNNNTGKQNAVTPTVTNVIKTIGLTQQNPEPMLNDLSPLLSKENSGFSKKITNYFVTQTNVITDPNVKFQNKVRNNQIGTNKEEKIYEESREVSRVEIQNNTINNVNTITNNSIQFYHPTQYIMIGKNNYHQNQFPVDKFRSHSLKNSKLTNKGRPMYNNRARVYTIENTSNNHHSSMAHLNYSPRREKSPFPDAHANKSNSAGRFYQRNTQTFQSKEQNKHAKRETQKDRIPSSSHKNSHLDSGLRSVNELSLKPNTSRTQRLTLVKNVGTFTGTFSNLNDLLILLLKKILVYTSKTNALKMKLSKYNPDFNGYSIIREIDSERKGLLTLHDMAYCMHFFWFHLPDWDSFRLMSYLSGYKLATLEELIVQENISRAQELLVDPSRMENMDKSRKKVQNKQLIDLPEQNPKYSIEYADFLRLITSKTNESPPELPKGPLRIRENAFQLIRQIILLTFRKIDEVALIIRFLRKHQFAYIFDRLSRSREVKNHDAEFSGTFGKGNQKWNLVKGKPLDSG